MGEHVKIETKVPEVKRKNGVSQGYKSKHPQSPNLPVDPILYLQCTLGNQAIQRMMTPGVIQAKLNISQPGDMYEQEADHVTEQVMRIAEGGVFQRKCARYEEDKEEVLQAKELPGQGLETIQGLEAPPIVHEALRSPAQTLDATTRAFFEPRFGHDFSQVKIHTDLRAVESADALNALAYTVGNQIVFGKSQYAPHSPPCRKLLAHELAHTIQQSSGDVAVDRQDAGMSGCPENTLKDCCPESTIRDFCQPFASRSEARRCRDYLLRSFIPLDRGVFGTEVAGLWQSYLSRRHEESLQRRVFSNPDSELVQGFVTSVTTNERQRELADKVKSALPSNCPNLAPNIPTNLPVSQFLTREDLEYPINFNKPLEIPGHIAGGVGSSDAGPDLRRVSGHVTLRRDTDNSGRTSGIHMMTNFNFLVQDAIDFCPGDPGSGQEQAITIPLSRLEATGLFLTDEPFAYDVPFEVRYTGNTIDEDIDLAIVRRCFPDAPSSPPSTPTPPPPGPEPSEEERPERRS